VPKKEKGKDKDRKRRRLMLILPLILVTGTTGTLIVMNKVPFITSAGNGNSTVSVSGTTASAAASNGSTTSQGAHPASASASSNPSRASDSNTSHSSGGSSNTGGGSNSGAGSGTTSGSGTKTTAPGGPASGPSSSEGLVSGSEVTVNDCAGWLDFGNPVFYGVVSAGSAANCKGAFTYSSSVQSTTTTNISASDGNKASANSCNGCWYVGTWKITAKICVWNTDNPSAEKCSAKYTYDSTTNKITAG
jgi:hypothetical protein